MTKCNYKINQNKWILSYITFDTTCTSNLGINFVHYSLEKKLWDKDPIFLPLNTRIQCTKSIKVWRTNQGIIQIYSLLLFQAYSFKNLVVKGVLKSSNTITNCDIKIPCVLSFRRKDVVHKVNKSLKNKPRHNINLCLTFF